jgi:hypothetical protein
MCRLSLENYPPHFENLIGMWRDLLREPYRGISNDGGIVPSGQTIRSGAPVGQAVQASVAWLECLEPAIRAQVRQPLDSALWRQWHNTPLILQDPQIELEQLSGKQRQLALELVRVSLSPIGYRRVLEVFDNNQFLGELNGLTEILNRWSFTLSIFGEPSTSDPWGWQLFGHHLALNCVFLGEAMTLTPLFLGVEPDDDRTGTQRRLFEPHEKQALALMHALSGPERDRAVLYDSMLTADQPPNRYHADDGRMRGGAFQDNRIIPYEGLALAAAGATPRRLVMGLAEHFVENLPSGPAAARLTEIERELDRTYFAWIGRADSVHPFYFRLQSPVVLIEFDHHSGIFLANREPQRFHVHTVVRTPHGRDFGQDLLRQHYALGGHDRQVPGSHHSHDDGKTLHRHD